MKTLLALVATLTLAGPSFGQGNVHFANRNSTLSDNQPGIDFLVRFPDGTPIVGTNYLAQLYCGAIGSESSSFTPVAYAPRPFRMPTTEYPGTWTPGPTCLIPAPYGITGITDILLQVRVWDRNMAADWNAVLDPTYAGLYGASAVFSFHFFQQSPPSPADDDMVNFRGFTLIPEPGTVSLLSLGALGLSIFRRK